MALGPAYGTGGGTITGADVITAVGPDGITNTEIASVAQRIKGDIGAGLADLTAAEVRTLLEIKRGATPGLPHFGVYLSGSYYVLQNSPMAGALNAQAMTGGFCNLYPFIPQRTFTPAALGLTVTAGTGVTQIKVLSYLSDSDGWPAGSHYLGPALSSAAAVTNTYVSSSTSMPTFTEGNVYWLGGLSDGAPTVRTAGTTVLANLSSRLGSSVATALSSNITRSGITFASPPDPWGFASSQLGQTTTPLVIALM